MVRLRAIACLAVSVLTAAYGQSANTPRFEVASVKPSRADSHSSSGIKTSHGRLDGENVTLQRCIVGAYGVGPHQILGGPDWLTSERFQIAAIAGQPADDDAVLMVMLQGLLADRFKLVLHRETKTMRAYALEVAAKGPKLEKAGLGESVTNTSSGNSGVIIDIRHTGMDSFAKILSRKLERPVVNHTGLEGLFNFKLQWMPESFKPGETVPPDGPSIFTAIQEQLGLRLVSQKMPVEMLVIDHAEKPSEN